MAKAFLLVHLSLLLLSCFTVYGEEQDTVSFAAQPPYHHSVSPALAPSHDHHHHPPSTPPAYPPRHHHHHAHPPANAPVHPPMHHHHPHPHPHPPTHSPVHPPTAAPTHPPTHPPTRPPTHPPTYPPKYPFPRSFVAVQGVVYCKSCKYAGSDTLLGATPVLGAIVKLQCNNTKYPQEVKCKTDKNGYFYLEAPKTVTTYGAHKCKVLLVSSPLPSCQKPSLLHGGATGATLRPEKPFISNKHPFVLFSVGPLAFEPKCY